MGDYRGVAFLTVVCVQVIMENPGISPDGFGMLRVKLVEFRIFLLLSLPFQACKTKKKTNKKNSQQRNSDWDRDYC